jgi:2-dehydropantoate 2-reductase
MGTGGIGGFFGARLARSGEAVAFVARGEHLRAIQAGGLHIRSVEGDFTIEAPATDRLWKECTRRSGT